MPLEFKQVTHRYGDEINGRAALKDVNLTISENSFTGLVGHTGSGKSTLVQLAGSLLMPSEGAVLIDGVNSREKGDAARAVKRRVGLVFQYPEHQLFEETVAKDIAFGPRNQGLTDAEIDERVHEAMALVGLDYDYFAPRAPFDLSGGQKRRVALAGVLAMRPKYLILDEPTAGLDPLGRDRVLENVTRLHREAGMGILLVSHSMDDVADYAERIIVMNGGQVAFDDTPQAVFRHEEALREMGLGVPQVTMLLRRLKAAGLPVETDAITIDGARRAIVAALAERKGETDGL